MASDNSACGVELVATARGGVAVWHSSDGNEYRVWATRNGAGRYGESSHACGGLGGMSDFDIMVTDAVAAAYGVPYDEPSRAAWELVHSAISYV